MNIALIINKIFDLVMWPLFALRRFKESVFQEKGVVATSWVLEMSSDGEEWSTVASSNCKD